jgi:hypothetical protein
MKYGVYYMPTRHGKIFANLEPELVASFEKKREAYEHCSHMNTHGAIDELHNGYSVYLIKTGIK